MAKLVLVRHGQSHLNLENRFTGWVDSPLTDLGREEARKAGERLWGIRFDKAYTSVLARAQETLTIMLDVLGQQDLPAEKDMALNERHYGALQGLNKAETAAKHGEAQVKVWRRSYDIPPPPLPEDDPDHPSHDRRYTTSIPEDQIPSRESLKDTVTRFIPYWEATIAPEIKAGKHVLIVAHGNSLRALVKYLDNLSDEEIVELNIPTGVPLVYQLNDDLRPLNKIYLGDPEAIRAKAAAVANQGRAR